MKYNNLTIAAILIFQFTCVGAINPSFRYPQASDMFLEKDAGVISDGLKVAKQMKLGERKDVKKALDTVLFKELMKHLHSTLGPINGVQIERYYAAYPLFHIRHIALEKRAVTDAELVTISDDFQKKPFVQAALKWAPDSATSFGGELEFRGAHNLPKQIFQALTTMSDGEVSKGIVLDDGIHYVQKISKHTLHEVPEPYRILLTNNLEFERNINYIRHDKLKLTKNFGKSVVE